MKIGQFGQAHVALGDLDADLGAGLTQAAEVSVARLHVGDDGAPLGEVDAVGLGLLESPVDGLRAVHELREDEGEGVVRGDAAGGELLDDLVADGRAGHLDHHVGVDRVDLEGLRQHRVLVEGAARVDLAGEEALLVARRLEEGQEHVGTLLDDLFVEHPEETLGVEALVLCEDLLRDLLPARRVVLEGGQREGGLVVTPRNSWLFGSDVSYMRANCALSTPLSASSALASIFSHQLPKMTGELSHQISIPGLTATRSSRRFGSFIAPPRS